MKEKRLVLHGSLNGSEWHTSFLGEKSRFTGQEFEHAPVLLVGP